MTVEFWIKTTNTNTSHPITSGNMCIAMQLNGTGLQQAMIGYGYGGTWSPAVTATTPINDGIWHYIALVYDGSLSGGTLSLYIDGVLEDDATSVGLALVDSSSWYIGGRPSNTFVDGAMDEVRVSNTARSATEIADNY